MNSAADLAIDMGRGVDTHLVWHGKGKALRTVHLNDVWPRRHETVGYGDKVPNRNIESIILTFTAMMTPESRGTNVLCEGFIEHLQSRLLHLHLHLRLSLCPPALLP